MTRKTWVLAGAAILVGVAVTGGLIAVSDANQATPPAQESQAATTKVERGTLSAMVSESGVLTYRARSDGSPYPVINRASGTYTELPDVGHQVACGDVLYRVDDKPVVLLCGTVPAYRDLHEGDAGNDVRELNQNLGTAAGDTFTSETEKAVEMLQQDKGLPVSGVLRIGDAVVLPDPATITKVSGVLGGPAQPGTAALAATSAELEVLVNLDPSQQGVLHEGDRAQITLLDNTSVTGKVDRLGLVETPTGPDGKAGDPTIPVHISLDDPAAGRGLDQAPVRVAITTEGVEDVLSVPVAAIVGKAGGGFGVEVVRDDGPHELVAVALGLFDTSAGRVQVDGDLRAGDRVVVPSS